MVRLLLVLAAIGGAVLLVLGVWVGRHFFGPLPADSILRAQFEAHRGEFDALAAMALADSQLVGAGHDPMLSRFTVFIKDTPRFNRVLTEEEVRATGRSEYRRLLDRAGLGSISRSPSAIWFVVRTNSKAKKGFLFSERPMAPVEPALDGLDVEVNGYVRSGYVALAPRWYLFLESSD